MVYKPAKRNWERIEFAELRKKVDVKFNEAHDELSRIYYDHWKKGDYSVDFQGYKPKEGDSPEKAKQLFDKLHGLIFLLRDVALDTENKKSPKRNQELYDLYNKPEISAGGENPKTRLQETKEKIAKLKAEGIELKI